MGIGDVASAVVVVTTPPGYRVLPMPAPEIPRVWILESIALPIEKSERRWLHRTVVRMRPQETGEHVFPGGYVTIESASGEQRQLELQARVFEVLSVLPQFPDRTAPFGLQEPTASPSSIGFLWPALAGAALALAGVAAFVALRQLRADSEDTPEREQADAHALSLWEWAQQEIARAFDALDREPRQAANLGAHLLRHYVESRFHTQASASTTEELALQKAPLAAHSHWPEFVRVLRRMDELRFRPVAFEPGSSDEANRVRTVLEELRRFLESSSPAGRRS